MKTEYIVYLENVGYPEATRYSDRKFSSYFDAMDYWDLLGHHGDYHKRIAVRAVYTHTTSVVLEGEGKK